MWFDALSQVPFPDANKGVVDPILLTIPFQQIKEKQYTCVEDSTKLFGLKVKQKTSYSLAVLLDMLPDVTIELDDYTVNCSDDEYAQCVEQVIQDEIGVGEGSNFVIHRKFLTKISRYNMSAALSIFKKLLQNETGAHWIFFLNTGEDVLIGASPEAHITLNQKKLRMNPISGTYRYPESGPTLEGVLSFISTKKEADELFMVVEEELKMLAPLFQKGGQVSGPFLKEMSKLAHTEFYIEGETECGAEAILKQTMFSPAIVGSPIQNACRVLKKYEPKGRGYYAGVLALVDLDNMFNQRIDSCILIRTAHIKPRGKVEVAVGATIVRHSDPNLEALETRAKAEALFSAMEM